ncbi:hypothetical protein LK996_03190 [Lysobacter sp. A6]|uniref:Uncharacterized protein n=1 Tax=Noviluteimonas lactosilytica TaxID=2888523 RepID=A0ABS8JEQ6_9GAMM|nr:hypothetical protein [Lysobacter lactosilyticus]MCC8362082.1 hypothetical protein [Lysobacter lactosilyticus]
MSNNALPRALAAAFVACALSSVSPANAEAINGAIYTSTLDGTTVNANQYDAKSDVYLNGGPANAPGCNGGDLDAGDYYFQVTDPSGAQRLSSDEVEDRKVRVAGGVISENLGTHPVGGVGPCGSLAIQVIPFDDTPNGGGVYKLWITRVSDYVATCTDLGLDLVSCQERGFVGGNIKTDNFKVKDVVPPPPLGKIKALKFYDANANGAYDDGEVFLQGWEMNLISFSQAVDSTQFTGVDGWTVFDDLVPANDYYVAEGLPLETNWHHSATLFAGHDGSPINPGGPLTVVAGQTTNIAFGNYCTIPSGGHTLGFWSNKNGQAQLNDGGSMASEFAILAALNLRNANGSAFDPTAYAGFRTWLLNGTATNMAYMLSVQLAAMRLNVEAGFVSGSAYYVPYGGTVSQLIDDANALLGADGVTLAGDPNRAAQERVKNYLDELNNGAGVLSPTPCAYTF